MAGRRLFRINGLNTVWVNAQIPEAQVSCIPPGSAVEARATAWPGEEFKGRVVALLPESIRDAHADGACRDRQPGFSGSRRACTCRWISPQPVRRAAARRAERSRHRDRRTQASSSSPREGGAFSVANVTTGTEQGGRTTILSGLKEGQSIVLSGQFLIDSEASLKSDRESAQAILPDEPSSLGRSRDRPAHPLVDRQSLPGAARDADGRGLGRVGDAAHAARCDPRSVGCASHHPHDLSGAGAADRREPDYLSARDHDAVRAGREDRARLFACSAIPSSTSCSRMAPILTGRARACSNTSTRCSRACPPRRDPRSAPTPRAWAGSTSTRSSTGAARWICRSCARCRTGS